MLKHCGIKLSVVALLASAFSGAALAQTQTQTPPYFVAPNFFAGLWTAFWDPTAVPAGANLTGCKSTVDPHPVVLVNGTFNVMSDSFGALAPDLANAGYCVYTFNYGNIPNNPFPMVQAIGPVVESALQLDGFVNQVQQETGAATVDIIGYSQGGLVAEYYAKIYGGAPNIHSFVGLGPSTHGTTLDGLTQFANFLPGANQTLAEFCPACADQEVGSTVVNTLSAGPIAQPGVKYTVIDTQYETVVTPVGSSFILEPGVTNEYIQSYCPYDYVDHVDLPYDNVVIQLVKNALTPATAKAPNCQIAFPYIAQ